MPLEVVADAVLTPEQLAQAFGAFSSTAQALERSYLALGQELARLRRELDEERDLRRRREALAEVSALLAHEIRNPLGSVELFAGLLAGSACNEPEKGWIAQMQAGLRLVSATLNNILEFHGKDNGSPAFQPVELNGILRSMESFLAPLADRAGMRWLPQLAPGGLRVRGDRQQLEQVFLNLALNAFRFAAEGGVLWVRSSRQEDSAIIAFEDAGPGISTEVLARLFQPGATTRSGGTGLGLAVVRRIAEQHGGTISVFNLPDGGATFELRVPLIEAAAGCVIPASPEMAMGASA